MARHQHLHEGSGFVITGIAGDNDFLDVLVIEVADRSLDQVAFLVDKARCRRLQRQLADALPKSQQIFEIALDLLLRAGCTGGADDEPHALRNFEFLSDGLQPSSVLRVGDFARNAAAARRVRH